MSVARFHVCHFAVIKDFIYSARTGCYYFYFLYEELQTGMQANGGEKWRQFQLIISPSDILMHYCYNYSKMSSKDHHTSFFRLHFSPSEILTSNFCVKFWSPKGQYLFIPLPLWETGLLHALKYQVCYVTRATIHFLVFSLAWAFPCFGFFLIHSPMNSLKSAFSETSFKYGKTKCISQAVGRWRRGCVVFLSYKVTLIFFPFYNIWIK